MAAPNLCTACRRLVRSSILNSHSPPSSRAPLQTGFSCVRPFSHTPSRSGLKPQGAQGGMLSGEVAKTQRTADSSAQMAEALKRLESKDVGILPLTLIRPPGSELPPFLRRVDWKYIRAYVPNRRRLAVEWFWMKQKLRDHLSLWTILYWYARKDPLSRKKLRHPLRFAERINVARVMHYRFYRYLTEGDIAQIQNSTCDGLARQARSQIEIRTLTKAPVLEWNITKWNGMLYPKFLARTPLYALLPKNHCRVVSDKVVPYKNGTWLRQVVCEINSRQHFNKGDGSPSVEKDMKEWWVIQKGCVDYKEGQWKAWGSVKPSTLEDIEKMMETEMTETKKAKQSGIKGRFADLKTRLITGPS